ncbi:MAG: ParB/RepB/Spo0J family partition protein [Nitrososphaerota archaeon]|jgi:ParB family chromosome partitioning protein|nr:ParB/RepB/Spo0J family partition protein [Nitrososphaerota archaeon]
MGSAFLPGYMEEIDTRRIHQSKSPLRITNDPLVELTASIMEKGLLEPIVVRPSGEYFEVVAGNRRLEACRRLKIQRILCHVVDLDDRESYEVSLTENIHRKTLNPVEEGLAFRKYVESFGYGSASELARRIDKSPSYVSRRIALLDLPKEVRDGLLLRGAKVGLAQELIPLDDEKREELTELIARTGLTKRSEVRRLVRKLALEAYDGAPGTWRQRPSEYEKTELRAHMIERTLAKCIASLKESMGRFDQVMSSLPTDDKDFWILSEAIMWHRRSMNSQIDDLLRLRKRFRKSFREIR